MGNQFSSSQPNSPRGKAAGTIRSTGTGSSSSATLEVPGDDKSRKIRVGIIGAGPSGLSQLHAFTQSSDPDVLNKLDIKCFEKHSDWGGQWNEAVLSPIKCNSESINTGSFKKLRSNGPKECMEYADYSYTEHFGKPTPSFPSREVIYHYINGRATKSDLRRFIHFNHSVRWLSYEAVEDESTVRGRTMSSAKSSSAPPLPAGRFIMQVEDLATGDTSRHEFDYVIIATGHFFCQNIPYFEGLETFDGPVLHAHDFRDAEMYRGMDLLLIGASYSAEEIALQCMKFGASSIAISYRSHPMGFEWLPGIEERPTIERVTSRRVFFIDGSQGKFDAIILCTGYVHKFPFLDSNLKLKTRSRLYPPGLYEGVVWIPKPRLFYLGMQDQLFTLTMFDAQAWWVRDVILGKIILPSADEMSQISDSIVEEEEALTDLHSHVVFQAEYVKRLIADTDYPKFDVALMITNYERWCRDKQESLVGGYRNKSFVSAVDGTMGLEPSSTWMVVETKEGDPPPLEAPYAVNGVNM